MRICFLTLAFFLISFSNSFANYPEPTLKSPRQTMLYFLKTMKGYKLGDQNGILLALKAFDLTSFDETTRTSSGKIVATLLIQTLDRLEYIKVSNFPKKVKGNTWFYKKKLIEVKGDWKEVEIGMTKGLDQKWRFSKNTVTSIPIYYKSVKDRPVVKGVTQLFSFKDKLKKLMPNWTGNKSFIILNGQWLGIFLLIFLAFLIDRIIRIYIGALAKKVMQKKRVNYSDKEQKKFVFPIGLVAFSGVWTLGIRTLELQDQVLSPLIRGGLIIVTLGFVMVAYQLVDLFSLYLEQKARESDNKFDDILAPLFRKTAKFFVVAIGFIFIGDSLTLDMKSIIAGLGIGGLAFALAAKDTIGNIFGSLTVLLDRPFRIGDWVHIDGTVEGMVEEVGLRSTRIRTFYDSLITLPNGRLTNAHIDNYGQRKYRRFTTKVGVQYDTSPEKLEEFCQGIRQIIKDHEFTRKDYFHVYFNGFNNSSLDILVYVFWQVPNWAKELEEKHRFLMDILKLGNKMGIDFAFPTQTIHLQGQDNFETPKSSPVGL
ncbi:MAG: mechanosensitive ion channel family protein [Halobacteriovoraceae bacterium]|jgi:MscS family membrane protein|nr:mechanosensitive ion channel family protein [Halobacteriovoraceae bacterium]